MFLDDHRIKELYHAALYRIYCPSLQKSVFIQAGGWEETLEKTIVENVGCST